MNRKFLVLPAALLAGSITALLAPGHTPGHMVFHVESEGRQLVMTGDTSGRHDPNVSGRGNPLLSTFCRPPVRFLRRGRTWRTS